MIQSITKISLQLSILFKFLFLSVGVSIVFHLVDFVMDS